MKKIKELLIKYKEIIMYLIFGVATTGVNWVVYSLLMKAVLVHAPGSDDVKMTVSNVIAWIAAVIFAFITNKLWVFESKSWVPKVAAREFVSFVASRLATGVIEWLFLPHIALPAGTPGGLPPPEKFRAYTGPAGGCPRSSSPHPLTLPAPQS